MAQEHHVAIEMPDPAMSWPGVYSPSALPTEFQPTRFYVDQGEKSYLVDHFQKIIPPSLTVLTGVKGSGKLEVVKQLISTLPHLFAKVVLIDGRNPLDSLKRCAYNNNSELPLEPENEAGSSTECASEADEIASLYLKIAQPFEKGERVLYVFVNAASLPQIKRYLPHNFKENRFLSDVIVTSRSRSWSKPEDLSFYSRSGYCYYHSCLDFDVSMCRGLRVSGTRASCSQINGDLQSESIQKVTGGSPPALQPLTSLVSKLSRSSPEREDQSQFQNQLSPELHISKYVHPPGHPSVLDDCSPLAILFKDRDGADQVQKYKDAEFLFQILCAMDPERLNFPVVAYVCSELVPENPTGRPDPQTWDEYAEKRETLNRQRNEYAEELLHVLELATLIRVERPLPGSYSWRVIILRKMMEESTAAENKLKDLLLGVTPVNGFTRLSLALLLPHILYFNETHNIRQGYYNQFLTEAIQSHLKDFQSSPRMQTEEKEEIKQALAEKYPAAFQNLSKLTKRDFVIPVLCLLLLLADMGTDLLNAVTILRAGYTAFFCLTLFLVILPFGLLCKLHLIDRAKYNQEMNKSHLMSRGDYLKACTGTIHSYFLKLSYLWKFWWETDELEKFILHERLCVLRANAEYQGICEASLESLPQLLLQFPLYLLSYTEDYSELRDVMHDSFIPFELSLVVSLFVFGLALTKLESVYFGWNIDLSGIKLLGYRSMHLLLNVTHFATLVFCSGIVCVIFPSVIFPMSLLSCLSATAWILSNIPLEEELEVEDEDLRSGYWLDMLGGKHLQKLVNFVASFHPGFVEKVKERGSELTVKHAFVIRRLGHGLLFLQRRPRKSDIIYVFLTLSSVLISAFAAIYCIFTNIQGETEREELWTFSVVQKYSSYLILWFPLFTMWQVLRQLLQNFCLKYAKTKRVKKYHLKDPEGILRYPVGCHRWIQRRLYFQFRQNEPGVFSQTYAQVKKKVNKKINKKNQ